MPSSTQNSALYCYYFYSFVFMLFVLDTGYGCMHWDIYGGLLVVQCIKGWWWNWIWFLIIGFLDSLEPSEHHCWVFMWVQPNVCANKQKTIRQILDEGDMFFWQPNTWSYIYMVNTWDLCRNIISTMHVGSKLWFQEMLTMRCNLLQWPNDGSYNSSTERGINWISWEFVSIVSDNTFLQHAKCHDK
jgi:hypothetical protein